MTKTILGLFSSAILFVFFNLPALEGTRFSFNFTSLALLLSALFFAIFGSRIYQFLNPDRQQYVSMDWKI